MAKNTSLLLLCVSLLLSCYVCSGFPRRHRHWPVGGNTRFYEFKVQTTTITKLCKTNSVITVNGQLPGPVLYAAEDDRVIVKVTNESPYNASIHWHGVKQKLTCWADGPSYITQCPIRPGQTYTYEFTLVQQRGTLFYHAHISWLRATVHGAIVIYPKAGVPYPFPHPYEEHVIVFGEFWYKNPIQLERQTLASGGAAPPPNAYIINGHPGPLYNCSASDVYKIDVVPGKTYLLRLVGASLNQEHYFGIANHRLTIVEADADYVKPITVDRLMITPGQTINVLVKADQPIGKYDMALGPYMTARNVPFQNITSIGHFQYSGANLQALSLPAQLPYFNDSLVVNANMNKLRSLNTINLPLDIDEELFFTIGLNAEQCNSANPNKSCQGANRSVFAASMNNFTFVRPSVSILQAYYNKVHGYYTDNFPNVPLKLYDFVFGAPNNPPNDTQSINGTRVKVLEFGCRVQLILQDTGTLTTENHPMHLHGHSFHVVGYGNGNYNPATAKFNLVDPPYMNTIGVPVGGWAAIRFVADNPGVWFMHCHNDVHLSWGLSMVFITTNGVGPLETLPHPPADLPMC